MKALIPILQEIPLEFGITFCNFQRLNDSNIKILFTLWNEFEIVKTVEVIQAEVVSIFLSDIFSRKDIDASSIATAEFINYSRPRFKYELFEIQLIARSDNNENYASVLYDMVQERDKNYLYSPILHCANVGVFSRGVDTYILLVNHRQRANGSYQQQYMTIELIDKDGKLLLSKDQILNYNSTKLISFKEEYAKFDFKPGDQINLMGGNSQFAIFTIFFNHDRKSLGIEHSLPPIYYCSDIYRVPNRDLFYSKLGFNRA